MAQQTIDIIQLKHPDTGDVFYPQTHADGVIGLGTAAKTNSTAYATSTQGSHAESAYNLVIGNKNVNTVLAGPSSGSAGAASFRKLVAADIPSITKSKISDFPTTWALANITGADDLQAIEALEELSGVLKKTDENTWELDSNIESYASNGNTAYSYFTNGVLNAVNLPLATSDNRGGIKIGYTTNATNRNYALQLLNEQAYVNVPWTDTTYKLTLNGTKKGSGSTDLGSFYAPTSVGTSGQLLKSSGSGAPVWTNQSDITAGKATADADGNTISSTYLKLSGGTMTGAIKRYYTTASTDPFIFVASKNLDVWLWRISHTDAANSAITTDKATGFGLKYLGTGSDVNNNLALYADNQTGTQVTAVVINQNGQLGIGTNPNTSYRVYVNGNSYFSGTATITGNTSISGTLTVASNKATSLGGTLTVTGNTTLSSNIYLGTSATADTDWANGQYLQWDNDHKAWHLIGNFYADGFVSAGGWSDGSGTSGIDWDALATNDSSHKIDVSHIPNITTSKITDLESWISEKGYVTSSGITSVVKGTATSGGAVSTSGSTVTIQFPTAYSLPIAKYNTLGGVKPAYTSTGAVTLTTAAASNATTPTIAAKSTTSDRYYAIEADKNGILFVNVPWSDHTYTVGSGTFQISANGNTAVNTLYTANVTSASTALDFINGNCITASVTAASGTTPAQVKFTHNISGVTSGSYGDSGNQTPAYGGTFKVPYVTVDTYGHVTGISEHTVKIPASDNTDTKNTAGSTDTSSKIFLIGATSQAANPQTYSDNEVYVTSGTLTTNKVQIGGTAVTVQYNSTDKCIEFIFS